MHGVRRLVAAGPDGVVEVESVSAGGCELAGGEFGGGGDVERGVVRNVGAVAGVDVQGPVRAAG